MTIHLAAGETYTLAAPGANEDANATGDLDLTGDHLTGIAGNGATIHANGLDRALDAHPGNPLIVAATTITGGHVLASTGDTPQGGAIRADAPRPRRHHHHRQPRRARRGHRAGQCRRRRLRAASTPLPSTCRTARSAKTRPTVDRATTPAASVAVYAADTVTIDGSIIRDNREHEIGLGGGIMTDVLHLSGSEVTGNTAGGEAASTAMEAASTSNDGSIADTVISDNATTTARRLRTRGRPWGRWGSHDRANRDHCQHGDGIRGGVFCLSGPGPDDDRRQSDSVPATAATSNSCRPTSPETHRPRMVAVSSVNSALRAHHPRSGARRSGATRRPTAVSARRTPQVASSRSSPPR
ncbi:MAG: hypothetical protein U5R31_09890 [Acidimicrobiia bacterium]|nr:hypothetical protein [Acidimicrobiia bacterium]